MSRWGVIWVFVLSSCYLSEEVPPDQKTWPYDFPSNQNINQSQLYGVNTRIIAGDYENIRSVMIIKNDHLVYENHFQNGERNQLREIDRMTLIFSQLAVGLALDDGYIDSISTPIHLFLPDYQISFEEIPQKKEINLLHLLTHTAGFSWNESVISTESNNNDINIMLEKSDAAGYLIRKPLEAAPGMRYNFNSGTGFLIAKIIEVATGKTLEEYINHKIFEPLEIDNYHWSEDRVGVSNGSNGLQISPFDLLKIGQLLLDEGIWKNEELISFDWYLSSVQTQFFVTSQYGYAYYWNKFNPTFLSNNIDLHSDEPFFIMGQQGDGIFIIPEKDLAVVVYAENLFYGFYNPTLSLFIDIMQTIH
jgi:CubicO group peptidase (beta-lactamase class C family)